MPSINIRLNEYSLYFWLGDSDVRPFDVVDDLTAPLVVDINEGRLDSRLYPSAPTGCFSLQSRILDLKTKNLVDQPGF